MRENKPIQQPGLLSHSLLSQRLRQLHGLQLMGDNVMSLETKKSAELDPSERAHRMSQTFGSLYPKVLGRVWYEDEEAGCFAFLVREPITFGHSQLRMRIDSQSQREGAAFQLTARHVENTINTFEEALGKIELGGWFNLCVETKTSGNYLKTLILRVSADEAPGEYKIHLLPFFESNLIETTNDFCRSTSAAKPYQRGGLIHWLGKRELSLYKESYERGTKEGFSAKEKSWNLEGLAQKLKASWEAMNQRSRSN